MDYPFIQGQTPEITRNGWIKIILINIVSVLLLASGAIHGVLTSILNVIPGFSHGGQSMLYQPSLANVFAGILTGVIFLLINIWGFSSTVGPQWKELFKPLKKGDIWQILKYFVLSMVVGIVTGLIANFLFGHEVNPADRIQASHPGAWQVFLEGRVENLFQLLGEEFIAIAPFLALLQLGHIKKWSPKFSFWLALIASSILFATYHLSTYSYNLGYALMGLTFTRMALTLPFIKTKNLWVSFAVHYLYDLFSFLVSFLLVVS